MAIHKLSPRKAATAGPGKHEDGGGLRLVVSEGGAKKWVLRFTLNSKRREMGLGSYPDTGLAEARRKAENFRKLAKDGIDPINTRELEKQQHSTPTFTSCAARYIKSHRHSWRNAKHARQWVSTLKRYARPVIGKMPVNEIDTHHLLSILEPIWKTKTETAKRVQGRIENVLDFASAHKYRDEANPARWRGHLDKLLPKPSRVKEISHLPAMPYEEVSSFIAELQGHTSISSKALQFLILTATRTSEVLNAEWHEIDLAKATWVVPAERMKARREHRVPLSSQAVELLSSLPRIQGNLFVFPGARHERPLSNMAMLQLMRGMEYGVGGERGNFVPHGFRSSFRDWSGEVSSYPRDVAEMALAHTIENKVEAAYRRGDLFEKRRAMMQDWSDFISKMLPV